MSCSKTKRAFGWTREIIKDLIVLYESQTLLYNTKSKDYKNKMKRIEAINLIKNQLQGKFVMECEHLTYEDINKKIHILLTQYLKEVSSLKKFQQTSGSSADAYVPKLWYFDMLQFVTENDPVTESETNLTQEYGKDRDEDDEIFFDGTLEELHDQNINEFVESPPSRASTPSVNTSGYKGRKRQLDNNSTLATILNTAVQSLEEHQKKKQSPHEEDELALFGKSIVAELRKVKDAKKLKELKKSIYIQIIDAQDE